MKANVTVPEADIDHQTDKDYCKERIMVSSLAEGLAWSSHKTKIDDYTLTKSIVTDQRFRQLKTEWCIRFSKHMRRTLKCNERLYVQIKR